jgi:kynurenine formamidase
MIDLTTPVNRYPGGDAAIITNRKVAGANATFNCHRIHMDSNTGTHINFPSHLDESGSSLRSGDVDIKEFWMLPTAVIHVDLNGRKTVSADMLATALDAPIRDHLIVHALGEKDQSHYPGGQGRPGFDESAVQWLLAQPFRILTSDVLENPEPENRTDICGRLYKAGRCIVFGAHNLHLIKQSECKSCIIPLCADGLTQAPCRLLASQG